MARVGTLDVVHWMGGFDLAGRGALTEINESMESHVADVTPLGPEGAIMTETPLGRVRYTLSEKGHVRGRQKSLRRLIAQAPNANPWPSVLGFYGGDPGSEVRIATKMRATVKQMTPDISGITMAEVAYVLSDDGDVHDGQLVQHGVLTDTVDVGTTPAAAHRMDGGAASSNGAVIALMIDVDGTRFRGYPNCAFRLYHTANQNGVWSALGGSYTFQRDDQTTGFQVYTVTGTVQRYVALRSTFSGSRDQFRLKGVHNSGATDLTVDGGSGTERIEEGDKLTIGGSEYTVASAAPTATTGEWTVTLTSGLGSNQADNTTVTQTGTHVSLRRCAALARL